MSDDHFGADAPMSASLGDPAVLARRARIAQLCAWGKRIGYSLFAIALIIFFYGLFTAFESWVATTVGLCLLLGSIVLIPAIVFAYGVQAADREDRGGGNFH